MSHINIYSCTLYGARHALQKEKITSITLTIDSWSNDSQNLERRDVPEGTVHPSSWEGRARICRSAPPLRSRIPRATWEVSPVFSCNRTCRRSRRTFGSRPSCADHCRTSSLPSVMRSKCKTIALGPCIALNILFYAIRWAQRGKEKKCEATSRATLIRFACKQNGVSGRIF